ncbi:hypothetical protein PROPEN_01782 [Proteus penneri ATCC 35198]|nr:hypothetical protein PROPEN_01782 [Proteus penneri ATCC 35198]
MFIYVFVIQKKIGMRSISVSMQVGAWIVLVQAFASAKKTKAPNFNLLKSEAVSTPNNVDSVSFKKESQEK